jgi:hypothetical protein
VVIIRIIGVWFLLAAVITLVIDATKSLAVNQIIITSLGQQWYEIHRASIEAAQKSIETHIHPLAWDPFLTALLLWPSWALFALFGVILLWLGRKRKRTQVFSNF